MIAILRVRLDLANPCAAVVLDVEHSVLVYRNAGRSHLRSRRRAAIAREATRAIAGHGSNHMGLGVYTANARGAIRNKDIPILIDRHPRWFAKPRLCRWAAVSAVGACPRCAATAGDCLNNAGFCEDLTDAPVALVRSEERRVGEE